MIKKVESKQTVLRIRDPVPFGPPGSGIWDGKKIKIRIQMNIPDHIFESLEKIFGVKILKFFDADPGSGIFFLPWIRQLGWKKFGSGIRDKHPGFATLQQTNYSDAQRCLGEVASLEGADLLYEVRLHVPLSVVQELQTDGDREGSREVGCLSFTGLKQTEKNMYGVHCPYLIMITRQIRNCRFQIHIPKMVTGVKI
jgi:hypothetical protein